MAQVRGTFPGAYDNVDKMIFGGLGEALKEHPAIWRKTFNVKESSRKFERNTGIVGMGDAQESSEGGAYPTDLIREGYTKDFTHTTFKLAFEVTEEAEEDDLFDIIMQKTKWMAFSCRQVEEKRAANIYNNSFTTEQSPDGVSLFNTAHVLKGGGTARNRLATDADLSRTTLEQAVIDLMTETKFESGQVTDTIDALTLHVPPALEFLADRILFSTGLAQTADNDRNSLKRRQWTLVVNKYLTDTDAWFVQATQKSRHGICSYTRVPISMQPPDSESRTGNRLYKVRFRRSWGAYQWQNAFGTSGG